MPNANELSYNNTQWINNNTPVNQTNMNNIEGGIVRLYNHLTDEIPFTAADYTKLQNLQDGAEANYINKSSITGGGIKVYVDSSASKYITITKQDIGLGKVDNTSDAEKNVLYAETAGSTTYADGAGVADTAAVATKALQDTDGNPIKTTYAKNSVLNKGSATQPIYLVNGVPQNTTHTLGKSVPSNAVFTDTTDLTQMTGVLPISKGGTGGATADAARQALGLGDSATKNISDSTSAGAISSTSSNIVTERDVYFGLPTINGSHAYTSSTNIYAPTTPGTEGYVLVSSGTGAPTWQVSDNTPVIISNTAPSKHTVIWVDSANGYIGKVWTGTAWKTMRGAWG